MASVPEQARLGLVFSGGGARGAFEAGVFERLYQDERFRDPYVVAGTSAGAINAALIAHGKRPEEIRQFWMSLAERPQIKTQPRLFRSALSWGALLSSSKPLSTLKDLFKHLRWRLSPSPGDVLALWAEVLLTDRYDVVSRFLQKVGPPWLAEVDLLRNTMIDAFGAEKIATPKCLLCINTIDIRTMRPIRYVTQKPEGSRPDEFEVVDAISVDMVLASVSIPLLFPPQTIGPFLHWDGGVLANTPMAPAVSLGAERVVTVLVSDSSPYGAPQFRTLGDAIERLLDIFLENAFDADRKLLHDRNQLAAAGGRDRNGREYHRVLLYEPLRPGGERVFDAGSYLNFHRAPMEKMYQSGRRSAEAWLAAGPREDVRHRSSG